MSRYSDLTDEKRQLEREKARERARYRRFSNKEFTANSFNAVQARTFLRNTETIIPVNDIILTRTVLQTLKKQVERNRDKFVLSFDRLVERLKSLGFEVTGELKIHVRVPDDPVIRRRTYNKKPKPAPQPVAPERKSKKLTPGETMQIQRMLLEKMQLTAIAKSTGRSLNAILRCRKNMNAADIENQ